MGFRMTLLVLSGFKNRFTQCLLLCLCRRRSENPWRWPVIDLQALRLVPFHILLVCRICIVPHDWPCTPVPSGTCLDNATGSAASDSTLLQLGKDTSHTEGHLTCRIFGTCLESTGNDNFCFDPALSPGLHDKISWQRSCRKQICVALRGNDQSGDLTAWTCSTAGSCFYLAQRGNFCLKMHNVVATYRKRN